MNLKEIILPHGRDTLRFGVIGDTHLTATSPSGRKDNFVETSLMKIREVVDLANSQAFDFLLHVGDLFDRPDAADSIAGAAAAELRRLHMSLVVVPGGHDLFGHNTETVARTKVGLLHRAGLYELVIHPLRDGIVFRNDAISVQVTGTASHPGMYEEAAEDDYVLKEKNADFAIHMVHGLLMPNQFYNEPTFLIKNLRDTMADITLAGHYHPGWPTEDIGGGRLVANCGALVRMTRDASDVVRMPQILIGSISREGVKLETYALKCAKKGEEALDLSNLHVDSEREARIESFLGQIKQTQSTQASNLEEIVAEISQSKHLPTKVVQVALERVAKARQQLESQVGK